MTTEVNEFDGSMGSVQTDMPAAGIEITTDNSSDGAIAIGAPAAPQMDPNNVYVYANNITPVSYSADSAIVAFDVVFSVSCTEGDKTSTYQVVKRIGVDKMKMVEDAKSTTPISIVEEKAAPTPQREQPLIDMSKERFKALAGLK